MTPKPNITNPEIPASEGNNSAEKYSEVDSHVDRIIAPKSWIDPIQHSRIAITDKWYTGVFKLQNTFFHSTVKYFNEKCKFNYVMTPLSTSTISSPMGLGSDSLPVSVKLFDDKIYLADSMQFTLEYFLRVQDGLRGTYYISPSFRGEDPDSTHLNQFYHAECELLGDMNDAIKIAEQFLLNITNAILDEHNDIILSAAGTTDHITQVLKLFDKHNGQLPRITLAEALSIMPSEDCYTPVEEGRPELGLTLKRKGEKFLIEKFGGAVWLTDMEHLSTPFYQAYVEGTDKKIAKAADLLIGLGETLGLGERHETAEEVCEALDHHEVEQSEYQWYIDMRKVKPLKTSGWGMGTERYFCWLLKHDDIRDIAILPRLKGLKYLP
uniref:Aminoacyl-transfer RNA synthetases class-II family profile domain-containing protein n=1 Tax=Panagrolaimus sp. ES5 TaxID=591445 RepID=A0AC34FH49_9BILA